MSNYQNIIKQSSTSYFSILLSTVVVSPGHNSPLHFAFLLSTSLVHDVLVTVEALAAPEPRPANVANLEKILIACKMISKGVHQTYW